LFRKVATIRETLVQENPAKGRYRHSLAAVYVDLALLARHFGRLPDAENWLSKAITLRTDLVRHRGSEEYREGLAWCHMHLASLRHAEGRPTDAEGSYRLAIRLLEELSRANPSQHRYREELVTAYTELGKLQQGLGQQVEARRALDKAREFRQVLAGDQSSSP
ncbi:MAG TPA: tetratricopeptide repeat protein, partial [Pirellulales bacterium]|nr:tetratricopeptide repeat protein [Pirellulales bacterium]